MRSEPRFRYIRNYPDSFPSGVKWLLIVNTAIFVAQLLASRLGHGDLFNVFGLIPQTIVHSFTVWQLVTYMFLHGGIMHILFNMLTLYWFGPDLERTWGFQRFMKYYFVCGIGAGLCVLIVNILSNNPQNMMSRTVGSSGAIYGLILAYGLLFPDRTILFAFIIPMKVRHFVWIMGILAFCFSISPEENGVSNVAHLGGILVGYAYIKLKVAKFSRGGFGGSLSARYQQWKLQRAKKKFQVYMRKHGGPGGTMLH
jgi:membrane associated rhomboid family serine protease